MNKKKRCRLDTRNKRKRVKMEDMTGGKEERKKRDMGRDMGTLKRTRGTLVKKVNEIASNE